MDKIEIFFAVLNANLKQRDTLLLPFEIMADAADDFLPDYLKIGSVGNDEGKVAAVLAVRKLRFKLIAAPKLPEKRENRWFFHIPFELHGMGLVSRLAAGVGNLAEHIPEHMLHKLPGFAVRALKDKELCFDIALPDELAKLELTGVSACDSGVELRFKFPDGSRE